MTANHGLDLIEMKLGRAEKKLQGLEAERVSLHDRYRSRIDLNEKTGRWESRLIKKVPIPLDEWTLDVGEILYHYRSSLDQLAHLLAGVGAGDHTAFPLTTSTAHPK